MFEDQLRNNEKLRNQLVAALNQAGTVTFSSPPVTGLFESTESTFSSPPVDVIVTANEINHRHGTGVLLQKIFGGLPEIVAIRSRNHYEGEQAFGKASFCLPRANLSRAKIFSTIGRWLGETRARRVLCVPYYPDDVLVAMAVKEFFDVPLCTFIMDDQNINSQGIPDALMKEVLQKSSLRLAISPDMRQAYETKYRLKFWLLPPVVSPELVRTVVSPPSAKEKNRTVILAGNIWGQQWLDLLRKTVRSSGVRIDWYCNAGSRPGWLTFDKAEMERDGITMHEALPEPELARVLQQHPFSILPSGTLNKNDDNSAVAYLSLPTRVPFILATSNTPILVIGHPNVASARFVKRFQLGEVCDYNPESFRKAVEKITEPQNQLAFRRNACALAKSFSAEGTAEWIWESLDRGMPSDTKFEKLMPPLPSDFAYYVEAPLPQDLYDDFAPTYGALRRLRSKGFNPNFVIDIGASTGVWSHFVSRIFPNARFILVDAIASRYDKASRDFHLNAHPGFELVEAAVADSPGRASFKISSNLYGSSILSLSEEVIDVAETVEVEQTTLDQLAKAKSISGRGIVKMDVQCAEHLILQGGRQFLKRQVDAVIIELSMYRYHPGSKTFIEMLALMDELGFRYFDDAGEWRSPIDGTLEQKDGLFLLKGLYPARGSILDS